VCIQHGSWIRKRELPLQQMQHHRQRQLRREDYSTDHTIVLYLDVSSVDQLGS